MEREAFVLTIFFLTLGPIKIIPAFAKLTQSMSPQFKREVAVKSILVAAGICLYVALLGQKILRMYEISLEGLTIAGGIVLLLSALKSIFPSVQLPNPNPTQPTAMQLAISPVATPIVIPPVGIAAILIFVMLIPRYPGMTLVIAKALIVMLILDFLVMFFIDSILKITGLIMALQVLSSVLVFIQVALAVETILKAMRGLGVIRGG
ncbi:MarC family protein [Trichothermofontia sp.]